MNPLFTFDTVIAEANRAILRAQSRDGVLAAACEAAAQHPEVVMAWAGLVDDDDQVVPVASAGEVQGYLDEITVSARDEPAGRGPVGQAIRAGASVVIEDAATDPGFAPWRDAALERGFATAAAFPLQGEHGVVGALAVYGNLPHAFSGRTRELLTELAEDISFGLRQHELADSARAAEARYRQLFENAVEGIFRTTSDGRPVEVNPAMARMLGFDSPEQILAEVSDIASQIYADPRDRAAFLHELRTHGKVTAYELHVRQPDGSERWIAVTARFLTEASDGVEGLEGMAVDITERHREHELVRRRDRILAAVADLAERLLDAASWQEAIDDALELLGRGTGTSRVSLFHVWCDEDDIWYAGHRRSWAAEPAFDLSGAPELRAIPMRSAGFGRWEESLLRGETIHGATSDFPSTEQGLLRRFDVESCAVVPVTVDGELWGWIGVDDCGQERSWDEVEIDGIETASRLLATAMSRQEAHELLVETDERLTRLIESVPAGIVFIDASGNVDFANPAAEEILDLHRSEVATRTYDDPRWQITAIDGGDFPLDQLPAARVMATGAPVYDVRHAIHHEDGTRVALSINAVPLRGHDGEVAGVVASFTDITDQLADEAALIRAADELHRSNDDLQRFAYVVSHDLQEPLRMIQSFLLLLQRRYGEQLDAEADEFIAFSVDGAQRLQRMITDLLAYSRVESKGREPAPTDVGRSVKEALANLQTAIEESGAQVEIDEPLPQVMVDGSQLVQVLQNLIGNALKFHGEDAPLIRVTSQPTDDGGWEIAVADNGIGLDPAHSDRVFEVFQRLHTRDDYPGTGIGLAICRRIVERHGGRIWVESTPGEGATFRLTLPGVP